MSDVAILLATLPRIEFACRTREAFDPETGTRLTGHQLRILAQLDDRDATMVTELAEYMGVTASTMSLNLKRLEEGGFISRSRDPADRRVMNVLLTQAGVRLRDMSGPLDPDRAHALVSSLRPHERRRALDGLAILADAADQLLTRRREDVGVQTGHDDTSPPEVP